MRKLATIRKIDNLEPIHDADRIELATVDGWKVVVAKNVGHAIGDHVVYCEVDSFLPEKPQYEFLRSSSYKTNADGTKGFRLRTMKLRGVLSQGLIIPLDDVLMEIPTLYDLGDDVSSYLGITKYEAPIPIELDGEAKGAMPSFIEKTDEERIQNFANQYEEFKKYHYYVSEKLDGTSATYFLNNGEFGACGRKWEYLESETSLYWKLAKELDIELILRTIGKNLAIQGEIIGPKIQKNRYKLTKPEFRVFNIYDIDKHEYVPKYECVDMCLLLGLSQVPTVYDSVPIPHSIELTLSAAEGNSILNPETEREGLVWVAIDSPRRISFKSISNKFLMQNE